MEKLLAVAKLIVAINHRNQSSNIKFEIFDFFLKVGSGGRFFPGFRMDSTQR